METKAVNKGTSTDTYYLPDTSEYQTITGGEEWVKRVQSKVDATSQTHPRLVEAIRHLLCTTDEDFHQKVRNDDIEWFRLGETLGECSIKFVQDNEPWESRGWMSDVVLM
jgi:hypothetical protein